MKKTITKPEMEQIQQLRLAAVLKKVKAGLSLTLGEEKLLNKSQVGGHMGTVHTMAQAATKLGVPLVLIKAAKRAGAPGTTRKNYFNCDDLKAWLDKNPIDISAHMTPMEKQKFRKAKADADKAEFANAVRRKEFFNADEVRSELSRCITTARSVLSGKSAGLAMILASLTGADPIEIETRIKAMTKEFIAEMHQAVCAVQSVKCPKCGEDVQI